MAAILERQHLDRPAALPPNSFHLRHGPVLVVDSLNDERRAGDARQIFLDVPAAKLGMQPDIVPSPERAGGVAMMAREFLAKIRRLELLLRFGDARHAEIFNKDMRREQDQPSKMIVRSRINQRD